MEVHEYNRFRSINYDCVSLTPPPLPLSRWCRNLSYWLLRPWIRRTLSLALPLPVRDKILAVVRMMTKAAKPKKICGASRSEIVRVSTNEIFTCFDCSIHKLSSLSVGQSVCLLLNHPFLDLLHARTHGFIHSWIHSNFRSFTHSFIHSFIHSFMHSFTYSGTPQ